MQEFFSTVQIEHWVVDQVVVFDWFDGPRQGVARMAQPVYEFSFELLAERTNPDGLDDRLFHLSALPNGTVAQILELIRELGSPGNVVWVPVWKFATDEERNRVDREIDHMLAQKHETDLVLHSRDMTAILGCWKVLELPKAGENWFLLLGIS